MNPPTQKHRVLVADDHTIVRQGVRLLIDAQPDLVVVGEAGNGKEVVTLAKELAPELIVMDLSMPELNGLQATARIKAVNPGIQVVALTVHEDESYLMQLCAAGASGYVLKRSAGEDLIRAIRVVLSGRPYFDAGVASKALARRAAERSAAKTAIHAQLSGREQEVLRLLAWGHTNKEIASSLHLSVKTVETYRVRIGEKLGLRSRTEMVQYALREGWMKEGDSAARS